jgi:hypothetical protein
MQAARAAAAESYNVRFFSGPTDLQAREAALLRDLIPTTLARRRVRLPDAWRSADAVAVASAIYAERRFDTLSVLADALEEAGCTHEAILEHLRSPGPHVLGCWAVDAVLGRS